MSDGSQEIDLDQLEAAMQLADNVSGGTGAPHALTISPRSLRAFIAELRRHRAMVTRLEACSAPYGLGPEDLDLLEALSRTVLLAGATRTREVLDRIIAAHRALAKPCPDPSKEMP